MTRKPVWRGSLSAVLLGAVLLIASGCEKKTEPVAEKTAVDASSAPEQRISYDEVLGRAAVEERFFTGLCRLLLTRSVLFATDVPPETKDGKLVNGTKFSVKVLSQEGSALPGAPMLFSSKAALAAAGIKFGWPKNDQGMYSFAAMNGQAAFRVLHGNGYQNAVLDAASSNAYTFSSEQMAALAEGKIPPFYDAA